MRRVRDYLLDNSLPEVDEEAITCFEALIRQGDTQGVCRALRPHAISNVHRLTEPGTGQHYFLCRFRFPNALDQQLAHFVAQGTIPPDDCLNDPVRAAAESPCRLRIRQDCFQKLQSDFLRGLSKLAQANDLRIVESPGRAVRRAVSSRATTLPSNSSVSRFTGGRVSRG
jgi:hypothetical protein